MGSLESFCLNRNFQQLFGNGDKFRVAPQLSQEVLVIIDPEINSFHGALMNSQQIGPGSSQSHLPVVIKRPPDQYGDQYDHQAGHHHCGCPETL